MDSHQIEAEAIKVVFFSPIFDTVNDVFPHHMPFRSRVIPDSSPIRQRPICIVTVKISRYRPFQSLILWVIDVIVDDVHDNPQAVVMQCPDHLLQFENPIERIEGIR
ncbi:hypothetical protein SDC9_174073 [bioreactor metagenome]|uniref:Uncharacterized protein n=1 Tax=bioreactor metagenome TaxID=1076179 RepID=A0A645GI98_9ZZZZ